MEKFNGSCDLRFNLTMLVLLLLHTFTCRSEKVYLYDNEIIPMVLNSIDTCVSYMDYSIMSGAKPCNIYLSEQNLPLNMPRVSINYDGIEQETYINRMFLPGVTADGWLRWSAQVSIDRNRAYVNIKFGFTGARKDRSGAPIIYMAHSAYEDAMVYYVYDCVRDKWVYEKIRGIGSKNIDEKEWPLNEKLYVYSRSYKYDNLIVEEVVDSIVQEYVTQYDDDVTIFLESRNLNDYQLRDLTRLYNNLESLNFNDGVSKEKAKKFFNKDGIIHLSIEYRLWKNKLYFTITESKEKWTSVKNVCKLIEKNDVSTETIEYEYNCDTGEWELCP